MVSAVEVELDVVAVVTPGVVGVDIARVVHMDALLVAEPIVAFEFEVSVSFRDSEEVV